MCGIAGTFGPAMPGLAQAMLGSLQHRGPDGSGGWSDTGCQLGVARLAVVDLAASADPLTNEGGDLRLAFNGEIYNHRELRAELVRKGHVFATRTDSEVVIHLYEEEGLNCLQRLRGMFAFALLDGPTLVLARDRLGIKPLYYTILEPDGTLVFASEIKALLQCQQLERRLDLQALADRIVLGHAVSTRTYLKDVSALAPGHTLTAQLDVRGPTVAAPVPYFDRRLARDEGLAYEEAERALEDTLEEALDKHLAADVPVGLALSGGLDSTMLALLAAARGSRQLHTFALGDYEQNPDLLTAGHVATETDSRHSSLVVGFEDYLEAIPHFVAAEEQPSSFLGLPFYLLSRQIGETLKVCLCGEGADELLGGYREYLSRDLKIESLDRRLKLLDGLGISLSDDAAEQVARLSTAQSYDEYLEAIFDVNVGDPLQRLHLDGVDKSAMAHGLEMRVPYLDDRVFALVSSFPLRFRVRGELGIRKYVLRRLALRRFGDRFADVILREKIGAPSAGARLLLHFDRLCEKILPEDYLDRHELGACFQTKRQLLGFEMFQDLFLHGNGDGGSIETLDYMRGRAETHASGSLS